MNRRERLIKIIGLLIIVFIILNFIPSGYYVMSPGIAQELSPIITVENGYKGTSEGDFMLTAVEMLPASAWNYLYVSLFKPVGKRLEQIADQLPEGMDMKQYIEIMSQMMEESKLQAQAVAFRKAGFEVEVKGKGVEIVNVIKSGSAFGKLQSGDIITAIDGNTVELATEAVELIRKHKLGENIMITVLRNEEEIDYKLEAVDLKSSPGKASIGVLIQTKNLEYKFPRKVTFHTEKIGGSSAGGMFALEIYNQLIAKDITNGKRIAGTGTISLDGTIGKIDGVTQKILAAEKAGADLFFVPVENYEEASKIARIKLVKIKNIDQALDYLQNN